MNKPRRFLGMAAISLLFWSPLRAQTGKSWPTQKVCSRCVQAHEEFLAADILRGRGSGTNDELVAATYIASQLRAYGIAPAGDDGDYIQHVVPAEGLQDAGSSESARNTTGNAVGILHGSDPALRGSAVLLSAHLDHLGVGKPVDGDDIYNGADDDASGVAAVLELARVLGKGTRPKRTVVFAFFGSEELGGRGSRYFRDHPPVPLDQISVNLEFEMIGRPDPLVKRDTLWLTGWNRSDLGPALAAHGANLVGDPHPKEDFFARSDNFIFAKKGIVAQTVSSYGLHREYHQPSDDIAHLDFQHMNAAIQSLLRPITWLVNSSFTPKWNAGGKP